MIFIPTHRSQSYGCSVISRTAMGSNAKVPIMPTVTNKLLNQGCCEKSLRMKNGQIIMR